ncbi:MAG TPA: FecR domain-containing protein [Nitrospiraceae bacterium]|nr:FecR domain-containing protein [Nitrospiraceae bacterium]
MTAQRLLLGLIAIPLTFGSSLAMGAENSKDGIGFYTAVLGQAGVTHPGENQILPVKLHDEVLFKDVIQTQGESRTKALFQDDSMLTVGENSRVEIDEYIYNPEKNVRQAVVKLMQGQVRALVNKVFKANGSRFEIHTPSAVAAARGTYFTVWVEKGQSGIINIGEKGRVDFTSGGMTVAVDPGFFSIAHEGHAPSAPLPHNLGMRDNTQSGAAVRSTEQIASTPGTIPDRGPTVIRPIEKTTLALASSPAELSPVSSLTGLTRALVAVELTTLREAPLVELPAQVLQALNLDARLMRALTTLTTRPTGSLVGSSGGGTTTGTTGTLTTGTLSVSVGTTSPSGGTGSVGSVSVGSTVVAPLTTVVSTVVAPVAPLVSTVVAPVAPLISTVIAPVAPVISTVVAPVAPIITTVVTPITPIISPVVAPVTPIIAPVIAPVTPIITPILATPPPVISGVLGLLTP